MNEKLSFEAKIKQIKLLAEQMQADDLSLADNLNLFEEASSLIQECQEFLNSAELKVEKITAKKDGSVKRETF